MLVFSDLLHDLCFEAQSSAKRWIRSAENAINVQPVFFCGLLLCAIRIILGFRSSVEDEVGMLARSQQSSRYIILSQWSVTSQWRQPGNLFILCCQSFARRSLLNSSIAYSKMQSYLSFQNQFSSSYCSVESTSISVLSPVLKSVHNQVAVKIIFDGESSVKTQVSSIVWNPFCMQQVLASLNISFVHFHFCSSSSSVDY